MDKPDDSEIISMLMPAFFKFLAISIAFILEPDNVNIKM